MLQSVNLSAGQAKTNKERGVGGGRNKKKNGNFNAKTYKRVYFCVSVYG